MYTDVSLDAMRILQDGFPENRSRTDPTSCVFCVSRGVIPDATLISVAEISVVAAAPAAVDIPTIPVVMSDNPDSLGSSLFNSI